LNPHWASPHQARPDQARPDQARSDQACLIGLIIKWRAMTARSFHQGPEKLNGEESMRWEDESDWYCVLILKRFECWYHILVLYHM
jgi:hypothetical protein